MDAHKMIEFIGCVIWVYGIDYAEKSAVMNHLRELKILLKRDQEGCDLNDSRISVYLFLRPSSWEHFKWKELELPNWEPDEEPLQLEKGNFIAPDYANVWPFLQITVSGSFRTEIALMHRIIRMPKTCSECGIEIDQNKFEILKKAKMLLKRVYFLAF